VSRPEGKKPLGTPRRRFEDNKIHLKKMGWRRRDWLRIGTGGGLL